MYSKTVVVGRLTRDPETKNFGESSVTRFSVAVDEGYGEKKKTHFYNCSAWNKLGENVQKYTKKGSTVLVEGMFISSKNNDITYWELRADNVKFLSSNNEGGQRSQQQTQPQQQYAQQNQYTQPQQSYQTQNQFGGQDPWGGFGVDNDRLPF